MANQTTDIYSYDYVHLLPEEQIDIHEQSSWELSYIIMGAGMRIIGDNREQFESGEVLLIPPHIPHCWYFGNEETDTRGRISNITITFSTYLLTSLSELFPLLKPCIEAVASRKDAVKFDSAKAKSISSRLLQMRDLPEVNRVATLISLLGDISQEGNEHVVGRYRKPDKDKDRLNQVRLYVICNYKRDISLDDVAGHVGMNRSSFCSFFKRVTGFTFFDYLNRYRIEQTCRMLQRGEKSISEICYNCGFNNVPYFNRLFKRTMGMSPGEYKLQAK